MKMETKKKKDEPQTEKGVLMELHVNAERPITDQFVSSIFKKLLENNMLPPSENFIQNFLNIVAKAIDTVMDKIDAEIDTVMDKIEDEDESEQETKH